MQKHNCTGNYCPTCSREQSGCTNKNTNKYCLVQNLLTATPEIIHMTIFYILVGKRERTIGDSKHKFKENNHHAISTHWYILIYVDFYMMVHAFEETLGENRDIEIYNY